jgi:Electron transfer DM13
MRSIARATDPPRRAIGRELDLTRFRSVVIWCRRFSIGFGVAPIA